jgi:site-specific recombinase XerD
MIPNGTEGNRDNKILVQTKLGQVLEQKKDKEENDGFNYFIGQYYRFLRQNNYSNNSIKSYCKAVRHVFQNKKLETLTQQELDDIQFDLAEHYQHNGNRIRFAAINLFCKEVLKKERKELYLKIPRSRIKNKDVLTNDQVEKLLTVAHTKPKVIYAVIQTLYQCGLRKMEACNLNVKDVNFESMELLLRNTKTGDGVVSMTTSVAGALREYMDTERSPAQPDEQALFLNKSGKRMGEHFVRNHLKKCAKEAGINTRVYPHMLRASCITHLLNKGVNPFTVQQHARHKDFRTTMIYNRPTQQQMKADIERVFSVKPKEDKQPKELKQNIEYSGCTLDI